MNMAKMTRTQKRKRLEEAAEKVWKVLGTVPDSRLTTRDTEELRKARLIIIKMAAKLN